MAANEAERLEALRSYKILDTPPEAAFDRIAELAAELFGAPMALVSFIDEDRQWLKSVVGLDATETSRQDAFCDHTIRSDEVMVIPDAEQDERFSANPYVLGDPNIRFYAGAPLRTPAGQRVGSLCVLDNKPRPPLSKSDRRRLEILAQVVVNEMELRVTNARLVEANRRAEAAGQAREAFLANMSHELRTPLTAIGGFAHFIAASDAVPPRERDFARKIEAAGSSMLGIVNDVLDLARIESSPQPASSELVDVREVAEDVLGLVGEQAAGKGLALMLTAAPALPKVKGSAAALRQALLNLVANAVKFTDKGEVRLRIDAENREVVIRVEDTGIGIAPDKLDKVFERFVQADDTIQSRFGGTGLGLAITRRLIERMDGSVEVTSRPGEGSCFTVRLPAA